jgi:hypothetical protein
VQPICGLCLKIGAKCAYEYRPWVFVAQQQHHATTDRPPPHARVSSSPPSLLPVDGKQEPKTLSLRSCTLNGANSIGDIPRVLTSVRVDQDENTTHKIAGPRTSHLHKIEHTDCPRDVSKPTRRQCVWTAKDIAQDRIVIAHIEAFIVCFRSPVLERIVGMTTWVEAFIPSSAWSSPVPASALGTWVLPRCKSHEYSNNAVALLNIGCSKGDDRLTQAGRRLHLATIQRLQNDVACPSMSVEGTFAALLHLLLASCYTVVSPGVATWLDHLMGQTSPLKTRLIDCKTTRFSTFLFMHYRQLNLIRSLVCRESMPLAIGDWHVGHETPSAGSFETMYRVAVKIPALLEITDRLVASADHDTGEMTRIGITLLQLESSLLEWFEAWAALHPSRTPLATALADLKATSEPCAALCFEESLIAALLWCLLLLLQDSVYALEEGSFAIT